jgi:cold shock CspA family protein
VKSGKVVSFSAEKRYGFITASDDESYFFHQSDVFSEHLKDIKRGTAVQFDDVPSPKGMTAKNITSVQTYDIYLYTGTDIFVSKTNACGRDNKSVLSIGAVTVEHQDPDAAVTLLKQKAVAVGCNAVINLQRGKRTGSSWTNSNYKYTIHKFTGEIALVKEMASTTDWDKAEKNRVSLENEIDSIKQKGKPRNKLVSDSGGLLGFCVAVIGFSVIVTVMMMMFRN